MTNFHHSGDRILQKYYNNYIIFVNRKFTLISSHLLHKEMKCSTEYILNRFGERVLDILFLSIFNIDIEHIKYISICTFSNLKITKKHEKSIRKT